MRFIGSPVQVKPYMATTTSCTILRGGSASFYLTKGNGVNYWIFNNVTWGTGFSTPPIGIDIDFASGPSVSHIYFYNNSFFSLTGNTSCINSGGGRSIYPATIAVDMRNNFCISSQAFYHWYIWGDPTTVTNGGQSAAQIDAANLIMAPAAAVLQGFAKAISGNVFTPVATTPLAPLSSGNLASLMAITPTGNNLTSYCSTPGVGALCHDINGNPRPPVGPWNAGAYAYTGKPNPPLQLVTTPH